MTRELQFIILGKKEVPDRDPPGPQDPKLYKTEGTGESCVRTASSSSRLNVTCKRGRALASDFAEGPPHKNQWRFVVSSNFWKWNVRHVEVK